MKTQVITFVIMVLCMAGLTQAVTVDPDAFAAGTVLNNAFPGVKLSTIGSDFDGNVYALVPTDTPASTGDLVFGTSWTAGDGGHWGFDTSFQPHLRVDFASAVKSVSIDAIGNDDSDYGRLQAYNSSGVLLGTYDTGHLTVGAVEQMSILRPTADIAYILAAGYGGDTVHLDNMSYSVPEPASMALLGLGGLLLRRRK